MKKLILILFFLMLFSAQALARPIVMYSTINDGLAVPILVYSSEKVDAYIPDDMINFNLFWSKYPQNGNFSFTVYYEAKDEALRQNMVSGFKERIKNRTVILFGGANPDWLKGSMEAIYFDMQNKQAVSTKEIFVDAYGNFMGSRGGFRQVTPLNEEHKVYSKIAENIAVLLEKAKNDPRYAYLIRESGKADN
ncbi:hypothetical protein [Sporomusa sp. KB1]|jgi:hypothetical protein|uniref:hypothetical protein n=1 Tax=Sporomusa sp. KB1 TaxID=943346 RepID=UPI0011A222A8|nr:hypothetical protein [Sporomusa sp. KB1]